MKYLNEVVSLAKENGILLKGVFEADVEKLETDMELKFPNAYKEFLLSMGRDTNPDFLTGADCFYDDLYTLKQSANELLEEDDTSFRLTENDFVFWMMQGMIFAFFKLDSGEDPEVFVYDENSEQEEFFMISSSFSGFLKSIISNEKGFFKIRDKINK